MFVFSVPEFCFFSDLRISNDPLAPAGTTMRFNHVLVAPTDSQTAHNYGASYWLFISPYSVSPPFDK
jgi:hypothetical protein